MNKLRTREQKLWRPGTGPAHVRYRFHVVIQRSPLTRSRLSHTHAKGQKWKLSERLDLSINYHRASVVMVAKVVGNKLLPVEGLRV